MKKTFILTSFMMMLVVALTPLPVLYAQEDPVANDDPLVEGLPDDVPQTEKKAEKKPAKKAKKKTAKKNTKKASKKKAKKKKKIYVDEYKFQTNEFEVEKISYKFNRAGDPIISQKAGIGKTRQFGKDYSQYWKNNSASPSIKTNASKNSNKKYQKPNAFDDNSKSRQSDELTLPDGLGQPNGLIVVDPIIEKRDDGR
ncbi:MAG: hypothetical protein J6Z08_07085 [Elusimicrobiales bacterium]|nr:hypothetical protein [Elusimicrobiales bacterium]